LLAVWMPLEALLYMATFCLSFRYYVIARCCFRSIAIHWIAFYVQWLDWNASLYVSNHTDRTTLTGKKYGVQFFLWWRAPQQMLRTHSSLKAYCATCDEDEQKGDQFLHFYK
jgi:hypothetical protein